jgi:hypothetical protein
MFPGNGRKVGASFNLFLEVFTDLFTCHQDVAGSGFCHDKLLVVKLSPLQRGAKHSTTGARETAHISPAAPCHRVPPSTLAFATAAIRCQSRFDSSRRLERRHPKVKNNFLVTGKGWSYLFVRTPERITLTGEPTGTAAHTMEEASFEIHPVDPF